MFCIAAFIVLAILGIFSASYRKLAKKAWYCVTRKVTFRKCDINFDEEVKGKLLGKIIITHPRLARFLSKWIDAIAFIFVILSIWSLLVVAQSGLYLLAYDTCDPSSAESCALGGEACSVSGARLSFLESLASLKILEWGKAEANQIAEAITLVPNRFKEWKAEEYVTENNTYYLPYSDKKPIALEIIDPGCQFCSKLFKNILTANFEDKYNVTYFLYPIPDPEKGYKFQNSYLMAQYVEAVKRVPLERSSSSVSPDWQLLEKIFTLDEGPVTLQSAFNTLYTREQAIDRLHRLLSEIGYSVKNIQKIHEIALSAEVSTSLAEQTRVVEDVIQTIKIPTILFDGKRFDRVVPPNELI